MHKKGLFIYRHAALYRFPIYSKIDRELDAEFCFCGQPKLNLKMLDYSLLSKVDLSLKEIDFPYGFYYLKGSLKKPLNKFDYIFINGDIRDISSWAILIKCKILRKKIYYWTHAWYGKESWFIRKIKRTYYSLGNDIFLYGNYAKNLMIKEGFNEKKLHVIYNSLDYEKQYSLRKSLIRTNIYKNIFNNNFPVVIFTGRLEKSKKLDHIILAQSILQKKGIAFNILFVGSGPEKQKLMDVTETSGLGKRVHFYGDCYDETILSELLYNADLCVSPGSIGLTVLHAFSYGTPVITHNHLPLQGPEFEAITDGLTGAFFTYGSVESLASAIREWLENHTIKTKEQINECFRIIDAKYNPIYQIEIIKAKLK